MLAIRAHPTKVRNLKLIHQVCAERHSLGSKDFSLKAVGEMAQPRGGPKAKVLWNVQSADYRKLIEAWQAYSGVAHKLNAIRKVASEEGLTKSIVDPAARIVIQKLIQERKSLRVEVNILKSQANLVIDRRPAKDSHEPTVNIGDAPAERALGFSLNQLEREALEHAISPALWKEEGWREEKFGRVVQTGLAGSYARTIFKPGFLTAIRKILERS